MKLRNLVILSSLVLFAACVNRPSRKSSTSGGPTKNIKLSMVSQINERTLNGTPAVWSLTGRCNSAYNIALSQTDTRVRLGDRCEIKLQSFEMPVKRPAQPTEHQVVFTRHPIASDWDNTTNPVIFKGADGSWIHVRLTSGIGERDITEASQIAYVITDLKPGDELTAELKKFPIEQIQVTTVQAPQFKLERMFETKVAGDHHDYIQGRFDLHCTNANDFRIVNNTSTISADVQTALKTVGAQVSLARTALQTIHDEGHASQHTAYDPLKTAIANLTGDAVINTALTNAGITAAVTPLVTAAGLVTVTATGGIGFSPDCTNGAVTLRPEPAYRQLEKCMDLIGNHVRTAGGPVQDWQCGTNPITQLKYALVPDTYHSKFSHLTHIDLEHIMGTHMCKTVIPPTPSVDVTRTNIDERVFVRPGQNCIFWRLNESMSGYETVLTQIQPHHSRQPIKAVFAISADSPVPPLAPATRTQDVSYSFYPVVLQNPNN